MASYGNQVLVLAPLPLATGPSNVPPPGNDHSPVACVYVQATTCVFVIVSKAIREGVVGLHEVTFD